VTSGKRLVSRFLAPLLVVLPIVAATRHVAAAQDLLTLGLLPIGQPVPAFQLPPVQGRRLGLSDRDLRGEASLVNLFASWCGPCREEHPLLMALARRGVVPIHGLNFRDKPADAERWLDRRGDPYARTGADLDGRVGGEWMVRGIPETFVVDRQGRIAYVHLGALDETAIEQTILPLIARLNTTPH
jgi:cytochrome c biogenesis protein CcmG/thiol:disulfide interchange protein DsbE